jgi:hypothetical protein
MTLETKQCTNSSDYKFTYVLLSDLKNGQIVVGCNQTIFFLNKISLEVERFEQIPDKDIII